jgi:hypothetical protein
MSVLEHFVKNKDNGFISICKHALAGGKVHLSEAEFTSLATAAAKRDFPELPGDRAFAKYFGQHQVVREAHKVVKQLALILPLQIGGPADRGEHCQAARTSLKAAYCASPSRIKKTPAGLGSFFTQTIRALGGRGMGESARHVFTLGRRLF